MMNDFSTIADYSVIDSFINKSLQDFNKKVFGRYDEKTGYFEEPEDEGVTDGVNEGVTEEPEESNSPEMSDMEAYDSVFGEDSQQQQYYNPNQENPYDPGENFQPSSGNVQFKQGITSEGLSFRANSIVNELSGVAGDFVVTSGKRSASENANVRGVKNSFHLTGDAVDIRPNGRIDAFLSSPDGKEFMRQRGYEIVDERNKRGAAHWHLEPMRRQAGGSVPVAGTKQQQFVGLNDPALDQLYMPLEGTNVIRGLDSYQPVEVNDEAGNSAVLIGPEDTIYMTGGVYERKLSQKYKTR